MMFLHRGDASDPATTYWVFLELKDEKTGAWKPSYMPKTPRAMASFGYSKWKKVEA